MGFCTPWPISSSQTSALSSLTSLYLSTALSLSSLCGSHSLSFLLQLLHIVLTIHPHCHHCGPQCGPSLITTVCCGHVPHCPSLSSPTTFFLSCLLLTLSLLTPHSSLSVFSAHHPMHHNVLILVHFSKYIVVLLVVELVLSWRSLVSTS